MAEDKITAGINKSGFPLQMALEQRIKQSNTGWRVSSMEHHWRNIRTDNEGYADLVLEKRDAVLVIECKRSLASTWAFLVNASRSTMQARCRAIRAWQKDLGGGLHLRMCVDYHSLEPESLASEYCVIVNDDKTKVRELLEATAANVLSATEAIARSSEWRPNKPNANRYFYSVVVTTARMVAAIADPSEISLADGSLSNVHTVAAPIVRFEKQLWSGDDYPTIEEPDQVSPRSAKVHTVLVVNSEHALEFLRQFEPRGEHWTP